MGYGFAGETVGSQVAGNGLVSSRQFSSGLGFSFGQRVGAGLGLASGGGAGSVIQSELFLNVNGRADAIASGHGEYRHLRGEVDAESGVRGSGSKGSFVAYGAAEGKVQTVASVDVVAFAGNGLVFETVESVRRAAKVHEEREGTEEISRAASDGDKAARNLIEEAPAGISGKVGVGNPMQGPTEALSHAGTIVTTLEASPGERSQMQHSQQLYTSEVENQKVVSQEGIIGSSSCKECGNQAKKDCQYQRCRTCCKSRGFNCSTHVKSTWVPISKRRERKLADGAASLAEQPAPKPKRARNLPFAGVSAAGTSITASSPVTSPHGSDINSSHPSQSDDDPGKMMLRKPRNELQVDMLGASPRKGTLPAEVKSQALFKCVRVTGVEDGEDEFAYQVTVKIGGHIFKGVLYDQGLDKSVVTTNLSSLQLGGRSVPSSSALVDPTPLYGSPGALLGGYKELRGLRQSDGEW